MEKYSRSKIAVVLLSLLTSSIVFAAAPKTITYEGVITDDTGKPVSLDSTTPVYFLLMSGSCVIHREKLANAQSTTGDINYVFGNASPTQMAYAFSDISQVSGYSYDSTNVTNAFVSSSLCTAANTEARFMRVLVVKSGSILVQSDIALSSAPYALQANAVSSSFFSSDFVMASSGTSISLAPTAVGAAGSVGNSSSIPVISYDEKGRITGASTVAIDLSKYALSASIPAATNGTFSGSAIPSLDASKITSGVFDIARIPAIDSSRVPNLDASKTTSGVFDIARIPAIDTARIPSLDASKISSGTFNVTRLPTSGVAANTYGSSTTIPQITVDSYGRVTAVTAVAVSSSKLSVSQTDINALAMPSTWTVDGAQLASGVVAKERLPASGVAAGVYGSATMIPKITVDAYGRVTSVSEVAASGGSVSGSVDASSVNPGTFTGNFSVSGSLTVNNGIGTTGLNTSSDVNVGGKLSVGGGSAVSKVVLASIDVNGDGVTKVFSGAASGVTSSSACSCSFADAPNVTLAYIVASSGSVSLNFSSPPKSSISTTANCMCMNP